MDSYISVDAGVNTHRWVDNGHEDGLFLSTAATAAKTSQRQVQQRRTCTDYAVVPTVRVHSLDSKKTDQHGTAGKPLGPCWHSDEGSRGYLSADFIMITDSINNGRDERKRKQRVSVSKGHEEPAEQNQLALGVKQLKWGK